MIIIYRGPKARGAPGPELWVPDETACLPEQSCVATGRGVWNCERRAEVCGIVSDGPTLEVGSVRRDVDGVM